MREERSEESASNPLSALRSEEKRRPVSQQESCRVQPSAGAKEQASEESGTEQGTASRVRDRAMTSVSSKTSNPFDLSTA